MSMVSSLLTRSTNRCGTTRLGPHWSGATGSLSSSRRSRWSRCESSVNCSKRCRRSVSLTESCRCCFSRVRSGHSPGCSGSNSASTSPAILPAGSTNCARAWELPNRFKPHSAGVRNHHHASQHSAGSRPKIRAAATRFARAVLGQRAISRPVVQELGVWPSSWNCPSTSCVARTSAGCPSLR